MDSKAQDDKVAAPASALLRECRDKGLDALSQTIAPGLRPEPWHAIYFALREITGRIDAHLAAGSGEGWVSVRDGLPDAPGKYLLAFHPTYSVRMTIGHYLGKGNWQYNGVTHWQHLPPAPQEKK